jgi:polyisoprenoid-binding protein YceI
MLQFFTSQKRIIYLFLMQLLAVASMAQVAYHAKDNLQLVVSGTSTLHDWTMKTSKGECNASFTLNATGQLTGLTALVFTTPAESMKSEHSSMDKNAYKALKSSKFPSITYTLTSATVAPGNIIRCQGKLTIAGVTQNTELVATAKVNADNSITISGSKKISMKDFSIDPPSFMLGTVKTGNDITLKFDLAPRKS